MVVRPNTARSFTVRTNYSCICRIIRTVSGRAVRERLSKPLPHQIYSNSILSNTNTITDLSISNDVSLKEHKIKNINKILTKPRRKRIGKDKSFSSRPSVGHEAKKSVASSVKEEDQSKMMKSTLDHETLHKMHDLKANFGNELYFIVSRNR